MFNFIALKIVHWVFTGSVAGDIVINTKDTLELVIL